MKHTLCVCWMLAQIVSVAGAQVSAGESGSVFGDVDAGDQSLDSFTVVLSSLGDLDRRVNLTASGTFEFRGLPFGRYELKVVSLNGEVVHQEFLFLTSSYRAVVRLPRDRFIPAGSTIVSVTRLRHKIPSKARKEFMRALQASSNNDRASETEHLNAAVALDPDFMEAHYNLGVQHFQAKNFPHALVEFQRAVELDPGAPAAWINLSATLLRLQRFPEAETAARKAVRVDGTLGIARYCLGLALLGQEKKTPEVLENLRMASGTVPRARLVLAELTRQ
jgi:tetratricopeptide (TPR) repeat protein